MTHTSFSRRLWIIVLSMVLLTGTAATALPRKGEKTFGPGIGYIGRNNSITAGLNFNYAVGRHLCLAPAVGVVFRHNNLDALIVDLDCQMPVADFGRFTFYPLLGVSYNSWGRHGIYDESMKDVTTHINCFGLNGGAGLSLRCNGNLRLGLEAKYTLMRHYPGARVAARIGFAF